MDVQALNRNLVARICVALLVIVFSIALLKPALKAGYYAEDHGHSNVGGILRIKGMTIFEEVKEYSGEILTRGRFYPITPILVRGLHYITKNARRYKFVL